MEVKSKPKHPKHNEGATKHKNCLLVKLKWAAKASHFKSFDCSNLTTEHCYFLGAQDLSLIFMKIFDKYD